MNILTNYSKYIISKTLDINTLTTFLEAFPIIRLNYKSIDIPFDSSILNNLNIIKENINIFTIFKSINIIYYSSIINENDNKLLHKIYKIINSLNKNMKIKFIQDEIFIFNNDNNFSYKSKSKFNIIFNINQINHQFYNNNYIPVYSFNDIKYNDLSKIEKMMNEHKDLYFTIDYNPYKFNNFNELNKHIKWDLYYDSYSFV